MTRYQDSGDANCLSKLEADTVVLKYTASSLPRVTAFLTYTASIVRMSNSRFPSSPSLPACL